MFIVVALLRIKTVLSVCESSSAPALADLLPSLKMFLFPLCIKCATEINLILFDFRLAVQTQVKAPETVH